IGCLSAFFPYGRIRKEPRSPSIDLLLLLFFQNRRQRMSNDVPQLNLPGEKSRALLTRRQEFVPRGLSATMNVFAAKADGAIIEDVDGNRFIDFAGGIGTMNVGHTRPEVTRAIIEQAERLTHTCFSVMMYESY